MIKAKLDTIDITLKATYDVTVWLAILWRSYYPLLIYFLQLNTGYQIYTHWILILNLYSWKTIIYCCCGYDVRILFIIIKLIPIDINEKVMINKKSIKSKIFWFILVVDSYNRQRKGHLIHKVSIRNVLLCFIVIYV